MNNNSQQPNQPCFSIEGWVARDGYYADPLESRVHFFINKPERVPSDRVQWWKAMGFQCRLPEQSFPNIHWSDEPLRVRIEIWKR